MRSRHRFPQGPGDGFLPFGMRWRHGQLLF